MHERRTAAESCSAPKALPLNAPDSLFGDERPAVKQMMTARALVSNGAIAGQESGSV